ncbi:MAG: carbamoyltransferase HypF [Nitrospirota bacterium]
MRLKIKITGLVQGVGFRPFVFRLAKELGLKGYVLNDTQGVLTEVEGAKDKLDEFLIRVDREKPAISKIFSLQHSFFEEAGYKDFEISKSNEQGDKKVSILPDIAVCDECIKDISTPSDRRFHYPFTNCTNCGPRFTIINTLPYDRKNTSMKDFKMCPDCEKEYNLPSDRRFHAQPDACPLCGPAVSLYDSKGEFICEKDKAIEKVIDLINQGRIIALKGIGGYHLVCDATNKEAVDRLRKRKLREEKPMAVMFPDLNAIKAEAHINSLEERALNSIEKPIVIVKKRDRTIIADSVSPDNSTVGAFLPYAPLHHVILQKLKKPIIATSANMTDEPIVKDEKDAFMRLENIADYILSHNREIIRRCDDSVVRISAGRQVPVRRSRGFAPVPLTLPFRLKKPVLGLGSYMNNTIAVGIDDRVFISQHIGDLDTPLAIEFYEETINDFLRLFGVKPEVVVSDMHPGYYSTKFGERHFKDKLLKVQHHFAHILSCMAENNMPENSEVIGFAFDGTGYGTDKTIWGSEVLIASYKGFKRVFHLRPYRLPGGDKAVKEPRRTAISLLYETFGDKAMDTGLISIPEKEQMFFLDMIKKGINSPFTTSMGRLFDGISSIIGLKHTTSYHAQAAIALEQTALKSGETGSYPFIVEDDIIDYRPLIEKIAGDLKSGVPKETIAKKFHNTIVEIVIHVSEILRKETYIKTVALSGGVFQNSILLENTFNRLKEDGFIPLIHQLVPPNDGGISLGQVIYGNFL